MKRLLLLLPLLLMYLVPVGTQGSYGLGVLYCSSAGNCLHEIGHKMNDELGYPSESQEFNAAVVGYLASTFPDNMDGYTKLILTQPGLLTPNPMFNALGVERFSSPTQELYANIYEVSGGDVGRIPQSLRRFYSADKKYTEIYQCLMAASVRICGLSAHMER